MLSYCMKLCVCVCVLYPSTVCTIDVDECSRATHTCSPKEVCVNMEGSYKCVLLNDRCDVGFVHNQNRECVGKMA